MKKHFFRKKAVQKKEGAVWNPRIMNKTLLVMIIILIAGFSTCTMGCLDDAVEIKGTVETAGETEGYGYAYIITLVVNGPARYKNFKFKVLEFDGDILLDGKAGEISLGSSIQFKNNVGNEKNADIGDSFIFVCANNCKGGELKVYYSGDTVGTYDL